MLALGGRFREEIGTINLIHADLKVRENATPRFHRPRQIPFALKEPVEQEVKHLETMGILKRVTHSDWAAPIVSVPKKDDRVRVCGDYKVTVNPLTSTHCQKRKNFSPLLLMKKLLLS